MTIGNDDILYAIRASGDNTVGVVAVVVGGVVLLGRKAPKTFTPT